jgi:HD-GYP domain-containing protein (c-di-GMP phosphodiesterase class II)
LFIGLERANFELQIAYDSTIEGWSHALDLRDKETEGHTLRVSETAIQLAKAIGINDADLVHKALEYIRSLSGTHFDPKVVETYFRVIGEEA